MKPSLTRRRGAIAPLTALLLTMLLGMAAFAVDTGTIVVAAESLFTIPAVSAPIIYAWAVYPGDSLMGGLIWWLAIAECSCLFRDPTSVAISPERDLPLVAEAISARLCPDARRLSRVLASIPR